jgi:phosphate transport system permease protein
MKPPRPPAPESAASALLAQRAAGNAALRDKWSDRLGEWLITLGGLGVIVTVLLIAFYLVNTVIPLFQSASIEARASFATPLPGAGETLYLSSDDTLDLGFRLTDSGAMIFFSLTDGSPVRVERLSLATGALVSSVAVDSEADGLLVLGLSNGSVILLRPRYEQSFEQSRRRVSAHIDYPYGSDAFRFAPGEELRSIAVREDKDGAMVVAQASGALHIGLIRQSAVPAATPAMQVTPWSQPPLPAAEKLLLSRDKRWLVLVDAHGLVHAALLQQSGDFSGISALPPGAPVHDIDWAAAGQSLLGIDDDGIVTQWFLLRDVADPESLQLTPARQFSTGVSAVRLLAPESRRKGFAAVDEAGYVSLFNSTAQRQLLHLRLTESAVVKMALSPWADALLLETVDGRLGVWAIDNQHPEVSWSALWNKVWYEGYPEPGYVWQSSAANASVEPKFSLVPLVFGTLKAAFFAMLIATPLALGGAIFTAYFMAPAMRERVKPLIELMEALPTVILGLLAGLWLAPFLEGHMVGLLLFMLALPVFILLAALGWHLLPLSLSSRAPDGWQAAFMLPVIMLAGWLCYTCSPVLEQRIFGGDFVAWLSQDLGVRFEQRNALVVGIAMSFAIIPTIFSIVEDAIFSVPRHLTQGALALGARPWQTLSQVVLPMASPAIFSALMIGLGRAVGETMIVLMATGNTPIMDFNLFEGMRTLAANIAMEIPEAEVDSTHYRVLFLGGLVLFVMTFVFNTAAEFLRQSMLSKYRSL